MKDIKRSTARCAFNQNSGVFPNNLDNRSSTAMAGHLQWLGLDGYIPSAEVDSMTFQTADSSDPAADITGSLVVITKVDGEIVKSLQVADDYVLSKIRLCFAASPDPTGEVIVKIYQGNPDPMAPDPVQTKVVFQSDFFAPVAGCNKVLVLDPTDPNSAIDPSHASVNPPKPRDLHLGCTS